MYQENSEGFPETLDPLLDIEFPPTSNPSDEVYEEDSYQPGSEEYKKARKRRQNRESAKRTRFRKRLANETIDTQIEALEKENSGLTIENAQLKTENELLLKELEFYKRMIQQDHDEENTGTVKKVVSGGVRPSWLTFGCIAALMVFAMTSPGISESVRGDSRRLLSLSDPKPVKWMPLLTMFPLLICLAYKVIINISKT